MTDDTLLMNGANGATPSYMSGVGDDSAFGEGMDGGGFPRLAFKGGRFRLRQGDEEIVMDSTKLQVIILKDFPAISRIFFAGAYDPDGDGKPACASADGEVPISTIASPQHKNCAMCPQNEKGSVITDDGRKSRACSFFKRLVILIKGYEDVGPVVTDIKAMSLFGDSQSGENLWSLKAYFARLKTNGVQPFHIVTELSFDTDESVPKVLFRPLGYVDEKAFADDVTPLIATPDGVATLELMVDTSSVKIDGDQTSAGSGFRDKLLEGDKPKHLEAPAEVVEPSLEEQLAKAVADSNFELAGAIQKKIADSKVADAPKQEPPPVTAKPELSAQDIVDGMKVDIKKAVAASDYALAGELQGKMEAFINGNKVDSSAPDASGELTPAQKGALTRAANKKKKEEADAREAASVAAAADQPADATPAATGDTGEGFGDELDEALKDFGF